MNKKTYKKPKIKALDLKIHFKMMPEDFFTDQFLLQSVYAQGTTIYLPIIISDRRLKTDIKRFKGTIFPKLSKINVFIYKYLKYKDEKHFGFIAQEVKNIFPELVSSFRNSKYLGINYIGFIPILVQAIKELNEHKLLLEKKIKELEKRIMKIEGTSLEI